MAVVCKYRGFAFQRPVAWLRGSETEWISVRMDSLQGIPSTQD